MENPKHSRNRAKNCRRRGIRDRGITSTARNQCKSFAADEELGFGELRAQHETSGEFCSRRLTRGRRITNTARNERRIAAEEKLGFGESRAQHETNEKKFR